MPSVFDVANAEHDRTLGAKRVVLGGDYDLKTTDTTDPNNIIVTYKKNNVIIRTETISIDGDIINETKT